MLTVGGMGAWAKPTTAHADVQVTYYASPTGSGSACTLAAPCALTTAQGLVRVHTANMDNDIVVNLCAGTYRLSHPLVFSSTLGDSGTHSYNVIYRAYHG